MAQVKIKFIKETEVSKISDEVYCSKKDAEAYVSRGYAKYVKESKPSKKAKLWRDKHVMGRIPKANKATAVAICGIDPENYDKIKLEEKGIDYFKELVADYETWAEVKSNRDIKSIKKILKLTETDLKEIWRKEIIQTKETQNELQKDHDKERKAAHVFTKKGQAEDFCREQPLFYDKSSLWWLWNKKELFWELSDEIDILNLIGESLNLDVVRAQERNEIINALKQVGRTKSPKPIKPTWIQFKDKIFDIKTGETLEPSPNYFATNPIPYSLNKDKFMETPVMDRIFEEWVGKDYIKTLYEIISYCLLPSYPMNRLFCFMGSGMNGKSKFLEMLSKFVGERNCTSTELDTLLCSRFEIARLHKKLVCQMGETNFNEMSKTSILKKLTGGDLIGFEYKNKDPFHEKNYAKILISTNNLPTTSDKTVGFYRRWLIIDFPNQFSEQKDILEDIPEEEYECLALKCCFILKELLDSRRFHKEGSIEDRMNKYEEKSDFFQKFIVEFTTEDHQEYITRADFYKKFVAWCEENRHRKLAQETLSKKMRERGIETGKKYFSWMFDGKGGDARVWFGIKWKE